MNEHTLIILGTAHDSKTPGKRSPDKRLLEYQYSRIICQLLADRLLLDGYECIIDTLGDEISLQHRCDIVNSKGKDCIYISIHVNAAGNSSKWMTATGCEAHICKNASENSKLLAKTYTENISKYTQLKTRKPSPKQYWWENNFYVLKHTKCPAILTENGFMDNKNDMEYLLSEKGMNDIVELHYRTITECLK